MTVATERAESVRTLAEILADEGGRDFTSRSAQDDGGLCVEILDHVSRDPSLILPRSETGFNSRVYRRATSTGSRSRRFSPLRGRWPKYMDDYPIR